MLGLLIDQSHFSANAWEIVYLYPEFNIISGVLPQIYVAMATSWNWGYSCKQSRVSQDTLITSVNVCFSEMTSGRSDSLYLTHIWGNGMSSFNDICLQCDKNPEWNYILHSGYTVLVTILATNSIYVFLYSLFVLYNVWSLCVSKIKSQFYLQERLCVSASKLVVTITYPTIPWVGTSCFASSWLFPRMLWDTDSVTITICKIFWLKFANLCTNSFNIQTMRIQYCYYGIILTIATIGLVSTCCLATAHLGISSEFTTLCCATQNRVSYNGTFHYQQCGC